MDKLSEMFSLFSRNPNSSLLALKIALAVVVLAVAILVLRGDWKALFILIRPSQLSSTHCRLSVQH